MITRAITEKVALVRGGSLRDSAILAALIHRHPNIARELGVYGEYGNLLSRVLMSDDAELVVCVAEELVRGANLAQDAVMAKRFFDRAQMLSEFMGAYALGKLAMDVDRKQAIALFTNAQRAGHIPSMIYRHKLISKRIPVLGCVLRILFGIHDFVLTWFAALQNTHMHERFWRYRDLFPNSLEPVDRRMPRDREEVFGATVGLEPLERRASAGR